jgi:hypothetical protein
MRRYLSVFEAAEHLSARTGDRIDFRAVADMAMRGEIRLCFYFNGGLNYFPELSPWEYSEEYCERHRFRGYLRIPPDRIDANPEWLEFYCTREAVESLHQVDGEDPPPARLLEGAKTGGFAQFSWATKADPEIKPLCFSISWADVRVPSVVLETLLGLQPKQATSGQGRWPWGTHETELLRHLHAAAAKWWQNFDPADNTTAPTNEQVSGWLQARGVAKRNADVIATMLRADGVPTGPRT